MKRLVFIVIVAVLGNVAVESHHGPPGRRGPHGPHGPFGPPGPHGLHGRPGPHGKHRPPGPYGPNWHMNPFRERPPWDSSGDDSSGPGPNSSDCDSSDSSGPCSSEEFRPKPERGPCRGWRCPPTTARPPKTKTPQPNTPWWETTPSPTHIWTLEPTTPWWETMTPTTTESNTPSTHPWWETTPSPSTPKSTVPWWETSSPSSPSSTSKATPNWWDTSSPSSPSSSSKATPNWWDTTSSTSKSTPNWNLPSPSTNSQPNNTVPWWETTTTNQIQTVTSSPDTSSSSTTLSADITACIKNCQSTNEYNPVCGTNWQTYHNMGKLMCAKTCGVNVDLRRKFACPPTTPTTPVTDSSTNGRTGRTPSSPSWRETTRTVFERCMIQCPVMPDYKPVCGTDLNTYINIDRLNCANTCGQVIRVLCDQPCGTCNEAMRRTTTTSTRRTTVDVARTTPPVITAELCLRACPMSPTYQPVCGTNNVTYTNIGHLSCAQICGDDQVEIAYTGACGAAITTTAAPTTSGVTVPPEMQQICMRQCPVTTEFNPVCGSDQVTYTNPGRLECAKLCGANVVLLARMPCNLISGSTSTTQGFTGTTVSIAPDILFSIFGGNTGASTPPTRAEKDKVTTTASTAGFKTSPSGITRSTVDFTLPPDVWSSIFDSSTFIPSTKPTPDPDYYNDYIDPRFGNDDEERAYRKEFGKNAVVFSE